MKQQRFLLTSSIALCILVSTSLVFLAQWNDKKQVTHLFLPAPVCQKSPVFYKGYMREQNGIESFSNYGWSFQGIAYVKLDTCSAGTLKIEADGESALNIKPELQIDLNSAPLVSIKIGTRSKYIITIPSAGHITLGYFNDYYKADIRVAVIRQIVATGCLQPPKLELIGNEGGTVDNSLSLATLYSEKKIRISICPRGTIQLRLSGQAGGGIFPVVRFLGAGEEIVKFQTKKHDQKITFSTNGTLDMELLNPYAKLIGDRNLNIRHISFTPNNP